MLDRLHRWYRRWRERRRQYAIERALYKAGGGSGVPHDAASRYGPPAATHMPDVRDSDAE